METETIRRKGTKNKAIINISMADDSKKAVWIFEHDANGSIVSSIRAPVEKVMLTASAKKDTLSVGFYDFPTIAVLMGGTIAMTIPIEVRNELIEHAVGYNRLDENAGQSGFCDLTTCEIE